MFELIGIAAATLTTLSFMPQVLKTIKSKDTESISFYMYLMFVSGVFCWIIYGFFLNNYQIITANIITFILAGIVLMMKIKDKFFNSKK
jgi:MtN3 and saliva related transmembrane protein